MKIVLIHGFNVKDKGKGTIDKLEPFLKKEFPFANIDKDSSDYGWIGLFIANWLYGFTNIIPRIAAVLNEADVVITHSNGAHFCMKALRLIKNRDLKIIHFSPALNSRWKFKESFKSCHVFHTHYDKTVTWSKYVPFSSWGNMGNVGALTDDLRVNNINSDRTIKNHSGWFLDHKIEKVFKRMMQELES